MGYTWILDLVRVLWGSHEEHMFEIMSESLCIEGIFERANPHAQGGWRFLGAWVLDDHAFELVWQFDGLVEFGVTGAFDDLGERDWHYFCDVGYLLFN
jgi:hypothetical protein